MKHTKIKNIEGKLFAVLIFSLSFTGIAHTKNIRSHVGEANTAISYMAATPFNHNFRGSKAQKKVDTLYVKLQNNLIFSGLVSLISPNAFQENTLQVSIFPKSKDLKTGFNYNLWSTLNTDFLIRGQIRKTKGLNGELQLIAYNVKTQKELLNYKANINLSNGGWAINRFSNHFYKKISGKNGFYETKITAVLTEPSQRRREGKVKRKNVYIMNWDGTGKQRITNSSYPHLSPTWSPNKRYVAYSGYYWHSKNKQLNLNIFIYDTEKNKRELFSYRKGLNSSPSFLPNGKHLLASLERWGRRQIFKLPLKGSQKKAFRLSGTVSPAIEPDMCPNEVDMVYSGSNPPRIYKLNFKTTKNTRLTHAGKYNSSPKCSPTGELIAFAGYPEKKKHFEIYTIKINGTNLKRITDLKKANGQSATSEHPSFSPDGNLILFSSNQSGKKHLYITNLDGSVTRQITFDNYEYSMPEWSP